MSVHSNHVTRYRISDLRGVRLRLMILMLAITGCAGPMGTIHSDTLPPPPVTAFDGTYRVTIRNTKVAKGTGVFSWCDTPGQSTITVENGQFTYGVPHPNVPGNPTPNFTATMAQDGSFSGQIISGTMTGQVNGTHMEGNIDGVGCLYAFTGDRG